MRKLSSTEHLNNVVDAPPEPLPLEDKLFTESELNLTHDLTQSMGIRNVFGMTPTMKSFFAELLKAKQSMVHTPSALEKTPPASDTPRSLQKFQMKRSWDPSER